MNATAGVTVTYSIVNNIPVYTFSTPIKLIAIGSSIY